MKVLDWGVMYDELRENVYDTVAFEKPIYDLTKDGAS